MLHDRQTHVAKRKHLWLPYIRLARTEAAQAIRIVKGRFFDRIRAFADSLNPPARIADDNTNREKTSTEEWMRTAGKVAGHGPVATAVARVLAMEPLVASRRMVRAALVGIR